MNADDHLPPADGADEALEKALRDIPCPVLPPDWRDTILTKAVQPAWPWLTKPVKWGLAACWAATGLMHLTMPPASNPPQGSVRAPSSYPAQDPATELWLADHTGVALEPDSPTLP